MKLTRRDALIAVVASTAGVTAVGELADDLPDEPAEETDAVVSGLLAAAAVVFPSGVTATDSFLRTYVLGREYDQEAFVTELSDTLAALDERSRDRYGTGFESLSPDQRDSLLRNLGVASVTPDPEGTATERIRYYVVNELLCALYTTPKGGRLLGVENPPGYPRGTTAYTEGPDDE